MNLDFAQEYFIQHHQNEMSYEAFLQTLTHGIALAQMDASGKNQLSNSDLSSLNLALSFHQHMLMKELIS